MGDASFDDRVLVRQRRQLRRVLRAEHRLAPRRDRVKRLLERNFLEGPRPHHLRLYLTGQRQHRDPIHIGIPQARQQVGGAGAGNRQACRRSTSELAEPAGRERRGPFVTDAEKPQAPIFLGPTKGLGHAEIRMTDHTEDRVESPFREHINNLIHE